MLRTGDGGVKDLARARELLRSASKAGFLRANCALASMLEKGLGGERDCCEAFQLRHVAAQKDNDIGQYRLAIMLEEGIGTTQNYTEAFRWFTSAAKSNGVKSDKAAERAQRMIAGMCQVVCVKLCVKLWNAKLMLFYLLANWLELRAPWSPAIHCKFPSNIQAQIETLLRLSLYDDNGEPRFPQAMFWMLPLEILFEVIHDVVRAQRIDVMPGQPVTSLQQSRATPASPITTS
jgi:hypothetical protein